MVKFKEFKIEDVLDWQPQKEINPLKIEDLTVDNQKKYPFYGQATLNNGIISYHSLIEDVLNNKEGKPTILIHSNNQNIVYLETPFYLKDGHGATSVLQSKHLTENIALYLITSIKKIITRSFSYNNKATKIALKNTFISLPIKENNEIDYEYMEKYIQKIKNDKNEIIITKLKKSNIYKSSITTSEKAILDKLKNGDVNYKDFRIGELFDIHPTKYYKFKNSKLYSKLGSTPVLSNSSINNGIGGYVDLPATEKGGIITFSDTTLGAETVFFQPNDFIGYSHIQGMYPYKPELWNENSMLYFMSSFKKSAGNQFNYFIKFTREIASNLVVKLPVTDDGDIDFVFMNDLIEVIKKETIINKTT